VSSEEEKNKALVRRFLEARVMGDVDAVEKMLAPNFVNHTKVLPNEEPGREGFIQAIAQYNAAFSNSSIIVEDQVAAGDKVVSRYTIRGIHQRAFRDMAPTGKQIEIKGVTIFRFSPEGKVVETWDSYDQLSLMRQSTEQELRLARSIQRASLPEEVPELEGWQISPYYQPAKEVGGDFYDFIEIDEERLGIVLGDATGKGVPAALVMASTRSMLRAVAQASNYSPADVLGRVNDSLVADIPPNMFVTCFYAILDPKSATLSYANAGHDLPYVRRGGDCEELMARGMPLGLMPGMSYEEKEITLEAGEVAFFYTDGLVEAHAPDGEMFGFPRLRALIAEHAEKESLEEALLGELYSFVGEGWEQEDDITLLTLRRSSTLS